MALVHPSIPVTFQVRSFIHTRLITVPSNSCISHISANKVSAIDVRRKMTNMTKHVAHRKQQPSLRAAQACLAVHSLTPLSLIGPCRLAGPNYHKPETLRRYGEGERLDLCTIFGSRRDSFTRADALKYLHLTVKAPAFPTNIDETLI